MGNDDLRPPSPEPEERDGPAQAGTESVERYQRAHALIERMRLDQRPDRAGATGDDPSLDVTAAFLRSAAPGAARADPGFAARLLARLEAGEQPVAVTPVTLAAASEAAAPAPTAERPASGGKRRSVSRRGLVLGGLGAAAAAVVGGAVGAAIEGGRQAPAQGATIPAAQALIPDGVGAWVAIARVSDAPQGAVIHFQTDAVIGYLVHSSAGFYALSGVCTHMACLLQWNSVDRTLDCPCHGSRFQEDGSPAAGAGYPYPPLPIIKTKVEQEQVWVYVISSNGSTPDNTATPNDRY